MRNRVLEMQPYGAVLTFLAGVVCPGRFVLTIDLYAPQEIGIYPVGKMVSFFKTLGYWLTGRKGVLNRLVSVIYKG